MIGPRCTPSFHTRKAPKGQALPLFPLHDRQGDRDEPTAAACVSTSLLAREGGTAHGSPQMSLLSRPTPTLSPPHRPHTHRTTSPWVHRNNPTQPWGRAAGTWRAGDAETLQCSLQYEPLLVQPYCSPVTGKASNPPPTLTPAHTLLTPHCSLSQVPDSKLRQSSPFGVARDSIHVTGGVRTGMKMTVSCLYCP